MGRRPSARKPSFMKILVGDFCDKLLIPPKFVRLHRGTLSRKCILRPSHTTRDPWRVTTQQMNNFLYFTKGWSKFARHHSLESGDLLVFRYGQESEFNVDMFDKSCCSKEPVGKEKTVVNPKTPPLLKAAEEIMANSELPTFNMVMRPIYVKSGGYLYLPQDFAKKHLKDSTKEVKIIDVSDKTRTRIGIARDRRSCRLTKGWSRFVREKALKLGDVCVFQLTDANDFTLKLTILRSAI